SRRRHTRFSRDWSSDVCSSDLKTSQLGVFFPQSKAFLIFKVDSDVNKYSFPRVVSYPLSRIILSGRFVNSQVMHTTLFSLEMFRSEERRVGKDCRSRCMRRYQK